MTANRSTDLLPDWLTSYEAFDTHVREAIAEEPTNRQGTAFSSLAAVLIPSTEAGQGFTDIEQSPKQTHDHGVDAMSGADAEGRRLVIQSKLTLTTKRDIDSILSFFWQHENPVEEENVLFAAGNLLAGRQLSRYLIVTLSQPTQALKNYIASNLSTRSFYDDLVSEGRIHLIDGRQLWQAAKAEFTRAYAPPTSFEMSSEKGWIETGNVRIGVVPARQLVELYRDYGDGLFFENIRSFLGLDRNADRETVNRRILGTAREAPEEFLARNNGITLRASAVKPLTTDVLELETPSIVNGCQTTMCLVEAGEVDLRQAFVTVKIVESPDAWEITHSANYQNRVRQIDLDLARYIRPQLVTQVASARGLALEGAAGTVQNLLSQIAAERIAYDDVKYLYRGLFSSHPNDLFDNNYNKLRSDVLDAFHDSDEKSQLLFSRIFDLALASAEELPKVRRKYSAEEYKQFERFDKPAYKSYLALIAAAATCGINLDEDQPDAKVRAEFIDEFLAASTRAISKDRERFSRAVLYTYQVLIDKGLEAIDPGSGEARVTQRLHQLVSDAPFLQLFRSVRVRLAGDADNA